ncbi:MAG TPA: AIPR family protein [Bryobacteraceae bacterium]|jgi:hypothetical protein|nr:AIPR family protein [Bryobacteraceae bacterium]
MLNSSFRFAAPYARRLPDPIFHQTHGTERHILFVPVKSVPKGLSLDPNARTPNLRRRIYQDIQDSLLDKDTTPGTFHLKHKGITVIAESVAKAGDDTYTVTLGKNHGIVDGGHTYNLIINNLENEQLPDRQFVKFEILVGIPHEWIVDIAGGLNTSVQVQPFALDNLAGKFGWIQNTLKQQPYYQTIAWKENQNGDFDARDIISLMTLFNVELFPNTPNNGDNNPVVAYEKKSKALELFEENPDSYRRLRPILKDILVLHDRVRSEAKDFHNEAGGKYGNLSFVEKKERGKFVFHFISEHSEHRLMNAALYPILGAFRWMVEIDPHKKRARWRGGFKNVLRLWRSSASELMRITVQKNAEEGRNPNAIGKSRAHWSSLYSRLAFRELQSKIRSNS